MQTSNNTHAISSKELSEILESVPPWLVKNNDLYTVYCNADSKENVRLLLKVFLIASVFMSLGMCRLAFMSDGEVFVWGIVLSVVNLVLSFGLLKVSDLSRIVYLTKDEKISFEWIQQYVDLELEILKPTYQESYSEEQHFDYLVGLARDVKKCEFLVEQAKVALDKANSASTGCLDLLIADTDLVNAKKNRDDARHLLDRRFKLLSELGLVNKDKGKIFQQA